jgi:hypothetical protein
MSSPSFVKSHDASVIESLLSETKVGDTVTFQKMSEAIGRDVRKFAHGAMNTARKCLLRDKRIVFDSVRDVGLVRLGDAEIVKSSTSDVQSIKRKSMKRIQKLSCVVFENLTDDAKRQHLALSSQLGVIAMFSANGSTKKIESHVKPNSSQLAIGETLKLFGG